LACGEYSLPFSVSGKRATAEKNAAAQQLTHDSRGAALSARVRWDGRSRTQVTMTFGAWRVVVLVV
jgi:hypothetical protein